METPRVEIRLRELMAERGVTQDDVASATGIPQSTLSRWAGNKVDRMDKGIILKLCAYFQCGIEDLISIRGDLSDVLDTIES